jgi:hypothetical protein
MRWILIFISVCAIGIAAWWLTGEYSVNDLVGGYIENGEFVTLEARYTPEQIMESHRQELIGSTQRTYQEPSLKFHPYLLMEVKYLQPDKKTREGVILWSMVDGEMVLNTDTWEKTHGFEDTIAAGANDNDFKILNTIAKNGGKITQDQLLKDLHLEFDSVKPWIDSTKEKQLIIAKGNELLLHFQNPKISVLPQTKITHWLVTKPYIHAQRVSKKYSRSQIENAARAAFGTDFTIRNTSEVFLPVYSIDVLNPDGSIMTSNWNALNGQRIQSSYLTEAP